MVGLLGKYFCVVFVYVVVVVCGGDVGDVILVLVVVELVYNFMLLYDDVMDGDVICRGWLMVWSVWGVGVVILLGDVLYVMVVWILIGLIDECVVVRVIR